jgi:8-oxo-dGTP pyrophosphatase MutT (NUDIX family)
VFEVLLITSLNTRRWILPKGWLMPDMTLAGSAAREAFEEAGVTGTIAGDPVGSYHYLKEKKDGCGMPCSVDVFALEVTEQLADWPEKGAREITWLPRDAAAALVSEPGLRQLLQDFSRQHKQPAAAKRAV